MASSDACALILTLVICGVLGAVNAALVNEFNMQPFIATMGTSSIIVGLRQWITWDAASMSPLNYTYTNDFTKFLGSYEFLALYLSQWLSWPSFLFFTACCSENKIRKYRLSRRRQPYSARLSGLNPKRISYTMFINNAVLTGLAGIIMFVRVGTASQAALANAMFTGLIAAMIGGISFFGGSGGMGGVFVGLCILQTFTKGMTIVNFDSYWVNVVQGLLFVFALSFDIRNVKKQNKSLNKKDKQAPEKITEKAGRGV
jgi:ribose/xylose/arabinose/galactoside ABC-type transport system permease subunit